MPLQADYPRDVFGWVVALFSVLSVQQSADNNPKCPPASRASQGHCHLTGSACPLRMHYSIGEPNEQGALPPNCHLTGAVQAHAECTLRAAYALGACTTATNSFSNE